MYRIVIELPFHRPNDTLVLRVTSRDISTSCMCYKRPFCHPIGMLIVAASILYPTIVSKLKTVTAGTKKQILLCSTADTESH